MNILKDLNEQQKEAVLTTEGPLLILAGAGSGKTKVLTTRIAYLIKEKNVRPYNIMAITFTNKAANEMKTRLNLLIDDEARDIQVSTFHSFGLKILRENYEYLGYDKNLTILDSDDVTTIIKKIMKELNYDIKVISPNMVKHKISSNKNAMITPFLFEKYINNDIDEKIFKIYKKYNEILKKNNSIDFDDLLLLPIDLFKRYPQVLEKYQEKYKYILIDEYQDTNEAQYIMTKMISKKYQNICCVGDVDQSIYAFRGANYQNILNFEKDYGNAKLIKLEQNYRSTSNILNAANSVIKNNKERKEKNLWSTKDIGDKISYYRANNAIEESIFVAEEIKKLNDNGVNYKDIAVLYRTNSQSHNIEKELNRKNIPYTIVGGIGFYNRKEIKDLLAYLKLIYNDKDDISLLRVINVPKRGIGAKTIEKLTENSNINNCSLYESISVGKEKEFKNIIEELKRLNNELTLTELVDKTLTLTGIKKEYEDENTLEADIRVENLEEFKSITKEFEERYGVVSLEDFLYEASLISDVEVDDSHDKVSLMTVHSVKGLEFDNVFIIGLEEGLFPHNNSLNSTKEIEEERRLCYVAITRARNKLYILNARSRVTFGQDNINLPSRFIDEIDEEYLEKINIVKQEPKEKVLVNNLRKEELDLKANDYVYHEIFGAGRVIEVSKTLATIAFKSPHGIKKLIKNHKALSKV